MLVKYKLEMQNFDNTVETQFKEKIESQLNEGIQDDVTMNSTTTWSPDKTKLFVATQFASGDSLLMQIGQVIKTLENPQLGI